LQDKTIRSRGSPISEQRGFDERLARNFLRAARIRAAGILVHHADHQILIEAAPVDANADGFPARDGDFDHGGELRVTFATEADVPGIDPVFGQGLGTGGIFRQQQVAVVVEVADERNAAAHGVQTVADARHLLSRFFRIDRDAHEFRAGGRQLLDLARRSHGIGRVGVGHGLDDDRVVASNGDVANLHAHAAAADIPLEYVHAARTPSRRGAE